MKKIFLINLLAISFIAYAQTTYVELPDGNTIVIKENKTWDFVGKIQSKKENLPSIDTNNLWKNENMTINTFGWTKSKPVNEAHIASYVSEKRDNYFAVYEEVVDLSLAKYIDITIKQLQKDLKKSKVEKQLAFKQSGRNHAQLIISGEFQELPVKYVYTFYSFNGGFTTLIGWTIGKNTAQIEDLKNQITLKN
jgi:hypothetical protein